MCQHGACLRRHARGTSRHGHAPHVILMSSAVGGGVCWGGPGAERCGQGARAVVALCVAQERGWVASLGVTGSPLLRRPFPTRGSCPCRTSRTGRAGNATPRVNRCKPAAPRVWHYTPAGEVDMYTR